MAAGKISSVRFIVRDFADGDRVGWVRPRDTEDDALAQALWYENHGRPEQADVYLDNWIQAHSGPTRH